MQLHVASMQDAFLSKVNKICEQFVQFKVPNLLEVILSLSALHLVSIH